MVDKYYFYNLYYDVPEWVYQALLSVLCVSAVTILAFKGFKKGWSIIGKVLLIEYVILIYCNTILFREVLEAAKCNYHLFWTYKALSEGIDDYVRMQIIMNIAIFIPLGILFCLVFNKQKWWNSLIIALGFSISIETLQFILKRGLSEFDDVFHNLIGFILGYCFVHCIMQAAKYVRTRHKTVPQC